MYIKLEDIKLQPQLIDPKIAQIIGRANTIVLMQMLYWSKKSKTIIKGRKWFYNSVKEWQEQILYYSESTLKRAIRFLEKRGFIISKKISAKKCNHTKWYSIIEEEVLSFLKEAHFLNENNSTSENNKNTLHFFSESGYKSIVSRLGQNEPIDRVILTRSNTKTTTNIIKSSSISNDIEWNERNNTHEDYEEEEKDRKFKKDSFGLLENLEKKCSKLKSEFDLKHTSSKKNRLWHLEARKEGIKTIQEKGLKKESNALETHPIANKRPSKYDKVSYETSDETIESSNDSFITGSKTKLSECEMRKVQEMEMIWNKVFACSVNPIKAYISKENAYHMHHILQDKFGGDIESFRSYAMLVNSSKFLMGEKESKKGFRASFTWLLRPEVIERILGGEYGVGDRELDQNNLSKNIEKMKHKIKEKVQAKICAYTKPHTSGAEEEAFRNYMLSKSYEEDGDMYGLNKARRGLNFMDIICRQECRDLYNHMFSMFVAKECIGYGYVFRETRCLFI